MFSFFFVVTFCGAIAHTLAFPKYEVSPFEDVEELTRIINGQSARPGQFPWQVANYHVIGNQRMLCGAALICDSWVLTAGHCVRGASSFTLHLGSVDQKANVEPGRVILYSREAYVHRQYNPSNLENDIALIRLPQAIRYTDRIQPIRLSNKVINANQILTVSGWGKTSDGSPQTSPILNFVSLTSISNRECEQYYGNLIKPTTLCCKGNPNHSTCQGDSGGPLVERQFNGQYEHVGIVSFVPSTGCARGGPAGFARTSSYIPWIKSVIGNTCTLL